MTKEQREEHKAKTLAAFIEQFPNCWFRAGEEFDHNEDCIAWSGEGSKVIEGIMDDAFELEAFDGYSTNYELYVMGVHHSLHEFAEEHNCFWEAYDMGTYLLYPTE